MPVIGFVVVTLYALYKSTYLLTYLLTSKKTR